jgi:hypothetical protein
MRYLSPQREAGEMRSLIATLVAAALLTVVVAATCIVTGQGSASTKCIPATTFPLAHGVLGYKPVTKNAAAFVPGARLVITRWNSDVIAACIEVPSYGRPARP